MELHTSVSQSTQISEIRVLDRYTALCETARMTPGERIRTERERLGWPQDRLAEEARAFAAPGVEIKQQDVQRIEAGKVKHSRKLPAIERALGIEPSRATRASTEVAETLPRRASTGATRPASTRSARTDEFESSVHPIPNSQHVPYYISGTAQAGSFVEVEDLDQSEPEIVYEEPDPDFPNARRFACRVAGDSMDALKPYPIPDGAKITGVAFADMEGRYPLRTGLIVVVQRQRDGGHLREWSVKQIEIRGDDIWFCPRSTNTKHKAFKVDADFHSDDGQEVEVLALVRNVTHKVRV